MFDDQDILDEYTLAASKDESHRSMTLPPARVLRIDGHNFVICEIESKARAFYLTVAEAFPGFGGRWSVILQTPKQIESSVRAWVEENQAA
jgi:hypothetical protein